ncbi:hypothetical protein EDD18DRAFT_1108358 [Armillaria luteobubalina]|uniref:Uncharacterized protein n=1 Tax=Armillaria luteobubalina TaxID=153913 RepID=A0AA39PZR4_9AGAR|nr:hypothetical protein EDD18DRAFT_1108358 [Armillaria luteobubalina]
MLLYCNAHKLGITNMVLDANMDSIRATFAKAGLEGGRKSGFLSVLSEGCQHGLHSASLISWTFVTKPSVSSNPIYHDDPLSTTSYSPSRYPAHAALFRTCVCTTSPLIVSVDDDEAGGLYNAMVDIDKAAWGSGGGGSQLFLQPPPYGSHCDEWTPITSMSMLAGSDQVAHGIAILDIRREKAVDEEYQLTATFRSGWYTG